MAEPHRFVLIVRNNIIMKKIDLKFNKELKEFLMVFYEIFIVSFIAAVVGNIAFEIFRILIKDNENEYIFRVLLLTSRFTMPFFIVLIYAFYSFIKNGFNKFLKFDRAKFIRWILLVACFYFLFAFFALINLLNFFVTNVMQDAMLWVGIFLTFAFIFAIFYNLAIYFLQTDPRKEKWLLLLKTILNLFIIPLAPVLLFDFISVFLLTVFRALGLNLVLTSYSDMFGLIARLIYPIFVLYYYIIYKDKYFKSQWVRIVSYLIISLFLYAVIF